MSTKKLLVFTSLVFLFFSSCQSGQSSQLSAQSPSDVHKVTVKEVLQTSSYTYLLVSEDAEENWLALPKMIASAGETYYYRNGFKMTNFESKELNRTFKTVYFLESISSTPEIPATDMAANPHSPAQQIPDSTAVYKAQVIVKKEEVAIQPAEKGITIAELFAGKEKYEGKTIRVKGKVTKFNSKIMSRNWIHLQDGTEYSGKFDLTVTTNSEVAVGDTVTLEGKIALNKDFGYGYAYEVLLEDAILLKN